MFAILRSVPFAGSSSEVSPGFAERQADAGPHSRRVGKPFFQSLLVSHENTMLLFTADRAAIRI